MPRKPSKAHRKVWRPVRNLPPDEHESFPRLLMGPHANKLLSRALGKRLQDAVKNGKVFYSGDKEWSFTPEADREFRARKELLEKHLIPDAGEVEAKRKLTHAEKEGLRAVVIEQVKILNQDPIMHNFFRKWYDIGTALHHFDTYQDIIEVAAKSPRYHLNSEITRRVSVAEDTAWRNAGPRFVQMLCHVALTQMMHRHLSVMKIPVSYLELSHAIDTITNKRHPADYLEDPQLALTLEAQVEQEMVRRRREARIQSRKLDADTSHRMKKIKKLLQGFDMPRIELKKTYREARERIQNRKKNNDTHITRGIAIRAFKRSRYHTEHVLRSLGINTNELFELMHIGTSRDNTTTDAMRNLKQLNEIIRTHSSPEERKKRIIAIMEEHKDLTQTRIHRIVPLTSGEVKAPKNGVNPRKQAEREARRMRHAEDAKRNAPASAETPRELPKGINGMIAYFRDEQTISRDALISLRKMLRTINPREISKDTIVKAIEYSILCEMATHHKKKGRVQERALRNETTPQNLFEYYKMAQANLMRQGILKYESHYGRSDFIALAEEAASRTLGKYDTKNGG